MKPADTDTTPESPIDSIESHLCDTYEAVRLDSKTLKRFPKRNARVGWKLTSPAGRELFLLTTPDFPYKPPRVAWPDTSKVLVWPHVESDGVICAVPTTTTVDSGQPAGVIDQILLEADRVVSDGENGSNEDEFRAEFLAYWSIAAVDDYITTLCAPESVCREVPVWTRRRGKETEWVIGETGLQLETWLRRTGRLKPDAETSFQSSLLLPLPHPPLPNEYPKTAARLRALAQQAGHSEAFERCVRRAQQHALPIVIIVPSSDGAVLVAVKLAKLSRSETAHGFTKKNATADDRDAAIFSENRSATLHVTTRRDAVWVHGRGTVPEVTDRQTRTVALIGCGSLGSMVAQHLADAGIGSFLLIDGDILSGPNTARHALGGRYHGFNKARALAKFLETRHPHMRDVNFERKMLRVTDDEMLSRVFKTDLILNCTGEWPIMAMLDDVHQALAKPTPLLTAWFEPHALACASVVTRQGESRLREGFEPDGHQWSSVTHWPEPRKTWVNLDGCAVLFADFGSTTLSAHAASVADHALQTLEGREETTAQVCISDDVRLSKLGGQWRSEWLASQNGVEGGDRRAKVDWPFFPKPKQKAP